MQNFDSSTWNFTSSSNLVVLTGAGISAESGIRTFRDSGGLWESHRIEDVATPEGFDRNPNLVIEFYNQRRLQLNDAQPNQAHIALANLEERLGKRMLVVTQNVDDLHDRAGSKNLIHMHGELKKLRCLRDESHVIPFESSQDAQTRCPYCQADMRPHIVWFGEIPFQMDEIQQALLGCTHFVYIGTSSLVYPAAGFRHIAKHVGAKVLCINLEVEHDHSTDFFLQGPATSQVSQLVKVCY